VTLLACGINHLTAPIELREKAAFPPERAKAALQELMQLTAVNEAVILSTCNRVEIYSDTHQPQLLEKWLHNHFSMNFEPYWYTYQERQAVSHIMRVASGLDSMLLGEPQILGQMKQAFAIAKEVGSIGSSLHRLFQSVFNVTKQVRTDTDIGANPITLGYAVVTLAKQIFSELAKRTVLLIGTGEIIELIALHLYNQGIRRFVIASRNVDKANLLAKKVYGHGVSIRDLSLYLSDSDIVISATSSEVPVLGKGTVERAIKERKHRPMFMVDLAVPRDIEPEVSDLEDVYLYNIDDMKNIMDDNRHCREAAAAKAEGIIELKSQHFIHNLKSLEANHLITQFRANLEQLSNDKLAQALRSLEQGGEPAQVLQQFATSLINKIAHNPSTQMRQAAFDGRLDMLALARQLLDIH
jgi:glutamyl-tRNA reductase